MSNSRQLFYGLDEDVSEPEKNTTWSVGISCRRGATFTVRTGARSPASSGYSSDWILNVPEAVRELAQMLAEHQKRELRIDLLEIVVNELKANVEKLQAR